MPHSCLTANTHACPANTHPQLLAGVIRLLVALKEQQEEAEKEAKFDSDEEEAEEDGEEDGDEDDDEEVGACSIPCRSLVVRYLFLRRCGAF